MRSKAFEVSIADRLHGIKRRWHYARFDNVPDVVFCKFIGGHLFTGVKSKHFTPAARAMNLLDRLKRGRYDDL